MLLILLVILFRMTTVLGVVRAVRSRWCVAVWRWRSYDCCGCWAREMLTQVKPWMTYWHRSVR